MIVGWRIAGHTRTSMVLDAIEMARRLRGNTLAGLRCHSDAGSQSTSIRYRERLAEIGAVALHWHSPVTSTTPSRRQSMDTTNPNSSMGGRRAALARPAPMSSWRMLGWIHWHKTSRLHAHLNDPPQQSSKPRSTLRNGPTNPGSTCNSPSLHQIPDSPALQPGHYVF